MFDIDDTVMQLDAELQHLGYGMTKDESDKIEALLKKYHEDHPGFDFESWWERTGKTYFPNHEGNALNKMKSYFVACKKNYQDRELRVVFNHEYKGVPSRMETKIFPEFRRMLRLVSSIGLPIAFTSKNPFIKFSSTHSNTAGQQFEAKLKKIAPGIKIWGEFNKIDGAGVDKQQHLSELYSTKEIHGLYFDDSTDYFNPSLPKLYLDPASQGFIAAHVDKKSRCICRRSSGSVATVPMETS
jgi:hypothetical protein